MSEREGRFPLLDGLRALAAVSVLVFHAVVATPLYHVTSFGPLRFAAHLDVGVRIFFVISGFLLYRPFVLARLTAARAPDTGAYAWRRLLRIGPADWVALAVITLTLSTSGVWNLSRVWLYLGLAQGYAPSRTAEVLPQAWTLTVEIAFYAFLPLYAWVARHTGGGSVAARARREWWLLGRLVAFSLAWKAVVLVAGRQDGSSAVALLALPTYLDTFAAGMALALLSARASLPGERSAVIERLARARPRPGSSRSSPGSSRPRWATRRSPTRSASSRTTGSISSSAPRSWRPSRPAAPSGGRSARWPGGRWRSSGSSPTGSTSTTRGSSRDSTRGSACRGPTPRSPGSSCSGSWDPRRSRRSPTSWSSAPALRLKRLVGRPPGDPGVSEDQPGAVGAPALPAP